MVSSITMCYGDISYHTPKMDSSNLNIFSELSRSDKKTSHFLRDIWQTDCKPRTASTSFVWLPFFLFYTITFTYHPLFELFFHRSYLKTTTLCNTNNSTVNEFQVLLFNTNYFIQHYSFGCTHLNGPKYCYASLTIPLDCHLFTHS